MRFFTTAVAVAAASTLVGALPTNNYGSSSDSSNSYGGSSGSSYGGSSGSSYGGSSDSSNSGCGSSGCGEAASSSSSMMMDSSSSSMMMDSTSSTMMMDSTSSTMMMDSTSSSMMSESTSTMMMDSTTQAMYSMTTQASYSTATYGSGSSNWGGNGYDSCVQQCIASFGSPQATYTPSQATASAGSYGTGATHTVIVAPTQGVLRYVPFAVNASVGDTVKFVWGANNHTVTKSSQLELCNKTSNAPFVSGEQNKTFVFTQVVNDTNPTFFYCGTPTHCQKGMFGIINPPNAANTSSSVASMMVSMASNSSDMSAMAAYTNQMTGSNNAAATWGANMDMGSMPEWAQSSMAENVLFTRNFLAANPDVLTADGKVDLGAANGNPLMVPQDITNVLNAASSSSASTSASGSPSGASSSAPAATSSTAAKSGARGLSASGALVGAAALFAAFVAL